MNSGTKKKYKAIALLSGGLDSRLAVKMMLDQGVEVEAINFMTVFCTCTAKGSCKSEAKKAAEDYGIPMKTLNVTEGLMAAVKNPKHGYGRGLNPCLDCRINMFRRAGEYMREVGADFIVTGEVLGERPMSQRPDAIRIIEEESELNGLVLRPLSAHLFEPTIPEQKGWVDRSRLMAIQGRSRKPQMQLADEIGVNDYPCPSGGCLLTDKNFSNRLKSLMGESEGSDPPLADIRSLRIGRIFFSSEGRRILIPRNEDETRRVANIAREGDTLMEAAELQGPTTLIRGNGGGATLREAAALTARYGQGRDRDQVSVKCWIVGKDTSSKESIGGENADGNGTGLKNDGGKSAADGEFEIIEVSPEEGRRLAENLERQ